MTTPHDKALKPCPFCGGEAAFEQTGKNELTLRCVGVQPSGLRGCGPKYVQKGGIRFTLEWLQGNMTEKWNTRAPIPESGTGDGWCQPNYGGQIHPRKFMVVYEDAEMGNAVFDDEKEAREHFEKAIINWNCYLFGLLPRRSLPTPRGGTEPNWWEEWVKTTRAYNALAKAAQAVIDETDQIHDSELAPVKYRAPYGSITKLREALTKSDRSSLVGVDGDGWNDDMSKAPRDGTVIWLGHECGFMEPAYFKPDGAFWVNRYLRLPIDWNPRFWQRIPSPPSIRSSETGRTEP